MPPFLNAHLNGNVSLIVDSNVSLNAPLFDTLNATVTVILASSITGLRVSVNPQFPPIKSPYHTQFVISPLTITQALDFPPGPYYIGNVIKGNNL